MTPVSLSTTLNYKSVCLLWADPHSAHSKQALLLLTNAGLAVGAPYPRKAASCTSMDDVIVSQSPCRKTMLFNGWFFLTGSFGLPVEIAVSWLDYSYDPVSLLTFPGRIWINLPIYTSWGLLPTFITGKLAVFCDLVSFFVKPFFTYKFLFLKFELHRFFSYKTRYALHFNGLLHIFCQYFSDKAEKDWISEALN